MLDHPADLTFDATATSTSPTPTTAVSGRSRAARSKRSPAQGASTAATADQPPTPHSAIRPALRSTHRQPVHRRLRQLPRARSRLRHDRYRRRQRHAARSAATAAPRRPRHSTGPRAWQLMARACSTSPIRSIAASGRSPPSRSRPSPEQDVCSYPAMAARRLPRRSTARPRVAVDGAGALYIADTDNCRVRPVTSGVIATVAGTARAGSAAMEVPRRRPRSTARLHRRQRGRRPLHRRHGQLPRKTSAQRRDLTVAGNGACAFAGDGARRRPPRSTIPPESRSTRTATSTSPTTSTAVSAPSWRHHRHARRQQRLHVRGRRRPGDGRVSGLPLGRRRRRGGNLYIADSYSDRVRTLLVPMPRAMACSTPPTTAPPPPTPRRPTPTASSTTAPASPRPTPPSPTPSPTPTATPARPTATPTTTACPTPQDTEPLAATGICAAFTGSSDGHPNPAGGDITQRRQRNGVPAPADAADNGPSWDTDNDGVLDGVECQLGTNPRSAASKPTTSPPCGGDADCRLDGLPHRPSAASGARRTPAPTPTAMARRTASRPTTPTATASPTSPATPSTPRRPRTKRHREDDGLRPQRRRRRQLPRRHNPFSEDGQPRRRHLLSPTRAQRPWRGAPPRFRLWTMAIRSPNRPDLLAHTAVACAVTACLFVRLPGSSLDARSASRCVSLRLPLRTRVHPRFPLRGAASHADTGRRVSRGQIAHTRAGSGVQSRVAE